MTKDHVVIAAWFYLPIMVFHLGSICLSGNVSYDNLSCVVMF